jgi:hypothetical protein
MFLFPGEEFQMKYEGTYVKVRHNFFSDHVYLARTLATAIRQLDTSTAMATVFYSKTSGALMKTFHEEGTGILSELKKFLDG